MNSVFDRILGPRAHWLGAVAVFVLAFGLRLTYFDLVRTGELGNPDSPAYEELALTIKKGQSYQVPATVPAGPGGFPADLQRPPGYPTFIALVNPWEGISRVWTGLVQSILGACFAGGLALLTGRLITPYAGLLAGFFYAIDWVTIVHTPLLIAETVYTCILALAFYCLAFFLSSARMRYPWISGTLLGVAALVKPAAQLMVIPFALAALLRPGRRRAGLILLFAYSAVTMPWMMRNFHHHGVFSLSEINVSAIYFYTAQGALEDQPFWDLGYESLDRRLNSLSAAWNQKALTSAERKRELMQEAWAIIRSHWPVVIKQAFKGLLQTCLGTSRKTLIQSLPDQRQLSDWVTTVVPLAQILLYWGLAIAGSFWVWRDKLLPRPVLILFIATIALALLPSASPLGYSRYRTHVVPVLCGLISVPAALLLEKMIKIRRDMPPTSEEISNVASKVIDGKRSHRPREGGGA